jgi:hypothetical protein
MKKTTYLIPFFSFFCFLQLTQAQILTGHVFQYRASGDSVALSGVRIGVLGQPLATVSKADGSYQLFLHGIGEGQKIQITIEKKGWKVLNEDALKKTYRLESNVLPPSVFLCLDADFLSQKQPFDIANYSQKMYQKRMSFLNHDWAIFQRTHTLSDIKLKTISDQKEELKKRQQFLKTHATEVYKFINIDNQGIKNSFLIKMLSFLKIGKIDEASDIINEAQYQTLKKEYLDNPRDTHRLSELYLLSFLKAQCAMMQFNAPQADFYFKESLGWYAPKVGVNATFYDEYIQFLIAFDKPKEAFENMQSLLSLAKMQGNTEGVAFAYSRLLDFYLNKKLYDLAQRAGQNALLQFDNLALKEKKEPFITQRACVMRQLAFVYVQQDTLPLAIKTGEKALISASNTFNSTQITDLRLLLVQAYQKMYERTGSVENRQKALSQLAILEKDFLYAGFMPPSVKITRNKISDLKIYIEDINIPRFLSKKMDIVALEMSMKKCKTASQTVFYRAQIIVLLQKLNNQLPRKSAVLNQELAHHYQEQAFAQIENRNFREVETNALKALSLNVNDDNLTALLATAQWLQNKKPTAQETFKTVKDSQLILKTINDFEKKGVTKSIFDPIRLDFGQTKAEL